MEVAMRKIMGVLILSLIAAWPMFAAGQTQARSFVEAAAMRIEQVETARAQGVALC
jgi:hypothetical protein